MTSSPIAASEIDLDRCRFLTIPATLRSSITRTWQRSTKALEAWWTRCRRALATLRWVLASRAPRSLAAFGPRFGSGQGLVGRLERCVRLLQCFHPLEALEGNALCVRGNAERDDRGGARREGHLEWCGCARLGGTRLPAPSQRHRPTTCALRVKIVAE